MVVPVIEMVHAEISSAALTSWELAGLTLPGCLVCLALPRSAHHIVSFYRLLLGTLYPAYASYKAIRNKDVEEYVICIHFSIVFAVVWFLSQRLLFF